MALNAANERDYTSGLNVDLGPIGDRRSSPYSTSKAAGSAAHRICERANQPFAGLHTLVISSDAKDKTVRLMVDGQTEGQRPRDGCADQHG